MTNVTNIADVKDAMEAQIREYPDLADATIEVHEPIPVDTTKHPWVGIFSEGQDLITRVIGNGMGNRRQNVDWAIFCAASSPTSGREAGVKLDNLMQLVLQALLSDCSIRGTTLGIGEQLTTSYLDFRVKESNFTQIGMIKFTTLGNTY